MTNEDRIEQDAARFAQALRLLEDSMPAQTQLVRLQAKLAMMRFTALLLEGFPQEAALKLCVSPIAI